MRKAALATAAVGVGGIIIGKGFPESTASSANVTVTTPGGNEKCSLAIWSCACTVTCTFNLTHRALIVGSVPGAGGIAGLLCVVNENTTCAAVGIYGAITLCYSPAAPGLTGVAGSSKCGLGVAGLSCSGIGVFGRGSTGVRGCGGAGIGLQGLSKCSIALCAVSCCYIGVCGYGGSVGVQGTATKPTGIPMVARASSCSQTSNLQQWEKGCPVPKVLSVVNKCGWLGVGTCAPTSPLSVIGAPTSTPPVIGTFKSNSSAKDKSTLVQLQNNDATVVDWNIGVAGKCNSSGVTDGSLYFQHPGASVIPLSINKCGYVGINNANPIRRLCITGRIQASCGVGVGTQTIHTTLAVNGSMAAKARIASTNAAAVMTTSDYALFVNGAATSATLPPANTQVGMIVFVKNISKTTTVSVGPQGMDKIEGSSSSQTLAALGSANSGMTFVSDGVSNWYIQSNSV